MCFKMQTREMLSRSSSLDIYLKLLVMPLLFPKTNRLSLAQNKVIRTCRFFKIFMIDLFAFTWTDKLDHRLFQSRFKKFIWKSHLPNPPPPPPNKPLPLGLHYFRNRLCKCMEWYTKQITGFMQGHSSKIFEKCTTFPKPLKFVKGVF